VLTKTQYKTHYDESPIVLQPEPKPRHQHTLCEDSVNPSIEPSNEQQAKTSQEADLAIITSRYQHRWVRARKINTPRALLMLFILHNTLEWVEAEHVNMD